ncbi:lactonase family protein [Knoellia sp. CPCC 206453]|uniref:lactonase family protein n=1 Tax=Knoellia pratensis TaxID=3404796 RepID=UPI003607202F
MSSGSPRAGEQVVVVASAPGRDASGTVSLHRWAEGALVEAPLAVAAVDMPTWLQWSPDGHLLYVGSELDEGRVLTFAVSGEGSGEVGLEELGSASTDGSGPCHFAFVPSGESSRLVVANYRDGRVSVLDVDQDGVVGEVRETTTLEGSGPVPERQWSSHPHMVVPGPEFDGFSVVDLGADEIRSFRFGGAGLVEHAVSALPPGTGPRQLIRVPGTDTAWLAGELSGTILHLREHAPGRFGVTGEWAASGRGGTNHVAHLAVDERRGLLHVSNRGPDTVSTFDISTATPSLLSEVATGAGPRHFELQDEWLLVGGQSGDVVSVHALAPNGAPGVAVDVPVPAPACVVSRPSTPLPV